MGTESCIWVGTGENFLINEVYSHNFQFLFSIQFTFTISTPLAPGQIVTTAQVKTTRRLLVTQSFLIEDLVDQDHVSHRELFKIVLNIAILE